MTERKFDTYVTGTKQELKVHKSTRCAGEHCVIHNPSDHHMRPWYTHYRFDRGIMERLCPHGIGHPDPDDPTEDRTHGCDGCCEVKMTIRESINKLQEAQKELDKLLEPIYYSLSKINGLGEFGSANSYRSLCESAEPSVEFFDQDITFRATYTVYGEWNDMFQTLPIDVCEKGFEAIRDYIYDQRAKAEAKRKLEEDKKNLEMATFREEHEREEYARLKAKYG